MLAIYRFIVEYSNCGTILSLIILNKVLVGVQKFSLFYQASLTFGECRNPEPKIPIGNHDEFVLF